MAGLEVSVRVRLRWWLRPSLRAVAAVARLAGEPAYPLAFHLAGWLLHHGVVVTVLET